MTSAASDCVAVGAFHTLTLCLHLCFTFHPQGLTQAPTHVTLSKTHGTNPSISFSSTPTIRSNVKVVFRPRNVHTNYASDLNVGVSYHDQVPPVKDLSMILQGLRCISKATSLSRGLSTRYLERPVDLLLKSLISSSKYTSGQPPHLPSPETTIASARLTEPLLSPHPTSNNHQSGLGDGALHERQKKCRWLMIRWGNVCRPGILLHAGFSQVVVLYITPYRPHFSLSCL